MTPQAAINEIGRLNRVIDDLRKERAAMHQDVIGQRKAMLDAVILFDTNRPREAYFILKGTLDYRNRQREPRKNTLTSG